MEGTGEELAVRLEGSGASKSRAERSERAIPPTSAASTVAARAERTEENASERTFGVGTHKGKALIGNFQGSFSSVSADEVK